MNPDQRLHDALHHSSQQFGSHSTDLVARATAHGRRLCLVRRAQIGVAAFVAAGLCVAGSVVFSGRPTSALPSPVGTPTATATPAPAPTQAPSASPPPGGPRSGAISAQLAAFMPPGKITRTNSNGTFVDGRITKPKPEGDVGAGGGFVYDDGRGEALIWVDLADDMPLNNLDWQATSPERRAERFPDGTAVLVDRGQWIGGVTHWKVTVLRPDGRQIEVDEVNTSRIDPSGKTGPTRPEPPLTIDQMRGIALSPHWNR